tara:strand:+ start:644 stop:1117 length:474 start_codon:yes stop_codon:yes gene_type:complete
MLKRKNIILEECQYWKELQKKIVFTNGCFDLFHQGHMDLITKSSAFGEILIVGLNSDKSVKSLKGKNRPIQSELIRKERLLQINSVSRVYIFDEDTPLNIIKLIKPDVLVKGGDYKLDQIIGGNDVIDWGGEVKIIPLTPGYSTSKIIKKRKIQGLV